VVEKIFDQCVVHGYHGIQLYEKVIGRLPGVQRKTKLGEVSRPVKAVVYGPAGKETDRQTFELSTRRATATSG